MVNFTKYYVSRLFKKWWSLIVLVPKVVSEVLEMFSIYFPEHKETLISVTNFMTQYQPYFPIILLLDFILVNFLITYDLWKKMNVTEEDAIPTGLNDDYEAIANFVHEITPKRYDKFLAALKRAYKFYTKQNSVNNIICTHFSVYLSINEIIKDCYKKGTIPKSIKTTELTDVFTRNYREINRLNDEIGKNNNINTDIISANKLIQDINNNLRSLLPYYRYEPN